MDSPLLIVEPKLLPSDLTSSLEQRGYWVESAELDLLPATLVAAVPVLVLCAPALVPRVQQTLENQGSQDDVGVFVVYDRVAPGWSEHPARVCGAASCSPGLDALGQRVDQCVALYGRASGRPRGTFEKHSERHREEAFRLSEAPTRTGPSPLELEPVGAPTDELFDEDELTPAAPFYWKTPDEALPSGKHRVSLKTRPKSTSPLSILLRDENTERGAMIASALRDCGHQVFLCAENVTLTPWLELRRFAPQVLIMDELAASGDHGQWLGALRSDPHLAHTPAVTANLARFDPSRFNLTPLQQRLHGLLRTEMALLGHLKPGREVEFDLEQVGISRLLHLLARERCHAQLTFVCERTLRWGVRDGQATFALLDDEGEDESAALRATSREMLKPAQALEWVLDHAHAQVTLHVVESLSIKAQDKLAVLLSESYHSTPLPGSRISTTRVIHSRHPMQSDMPPSIELSHESKQHTAQDSSTAENIVQRHSMPTVPPPSVAYVDDRSAAVPPAPQPPYPPEPRYSPQPPYSAPPPSESSWRLGNKSKLG